MLTGHKWIWLRSGNGGTQLCSRLIGQAVFHLFQSASQRCHGWVIRRLRRKISLDGYKGRKSTPWDHIIHKSHLCVFCTGIENTLHSLWMARMYVVRVKWLVVVQIQVKYVADLRLTLLVCFHDRLLTMIPPHTQGDSSPLVVMGFVTQVWMWFDGRI